MGKVLDTADIAAILETPAPAKSVKPAAKATVKSVDKLAPTTRRAARARHPDMERKLIDRIEKKTSKSLPALAREGHPILSIRSLVKIANEILGATEETGVGKGWANSFRERNRIRAKDIVVQDGEDEGRTAGGIGDGVGEDSEQCREREKIEKALKTVIAKLRPVLIKMLEENNATLNARTDKKIEATKKTLDTRMDKIEAANSKTKKTLNAFMEEVNSKTKKIELWWS
ncbi:uncharacterized protein IUM83_15064 [Phytophthora cinnamomi]|uniref:uncharacterized protein n=1 Tax=Phytophthora cinnamomi TaxID=4785 RepID=UPI0035593E72|nr:hypothetical protein IUM83_15064 [Phytophthora cinnamomi]